jgi:ribosome recycling factor
MEEIIKKFKKDSEAAIEFLKKELAAIRSSRPHPGILENVRVDFYNSILPLKQMANIQVNLPNSLVVQPWDKSALGPREKAIQAANLGVTVANEGTHLRVILPPLSQERREEIIGLVHRKAEEVKVNLRHIRDEAIKEVQKLFDDKKIGEDDKFRRKEEIQKIIDDFNRTIGDLIEAKEEELKA